MWIHVHKSWSQLLQNEDSSYQMVLTGGHFTDYVLKLTNSENSFILFSNLSHVYENMYFITLHLGSQYSL